MDVKEAVTTAKKELADILASEHPEDLRLEEAILDDANHWVVILSYRRKTEGALDQVYLIQGQRLYKVITMKKSTGEVISIRTRELGSS